MNEFFYKKLRVDTISTDKKIWAKDIEKGDEVKHWKYGWFKVVSVWHKKIMVQTKTGTMMIKEHDLCDHTTLSEKEN